jgi:endoglucanase
VLGLAVFACACASPPPPGKYADDDGTQSGTSGQGASNTSSGGSGNSGSADMHGSSGMSGSAASLDAGPLPPIPGVQDGGAGSDDGDDIYGTNVPRANAWWVDGARIHRGQDEVKLYGVSWFGLETTTRALFGPAQAMRSVADFLSQLSKLGFNALRVPLSPESINPGFPSESWANHGDVDTGREHFEALAKAAADAHMFMLLDIHTCASSVGHMKNGPADPACTGYGIDPWIADLTTLADLSKQWAPYVVGIDLFNEPYGLSYEDWRALAERAGRTVLEHNPNILVFVEGVGGMGYAGDNGVFWGENLTGVANAPPDLPPSRLVYSPHVYGPSVYAQPYFSDPSFPDNMPAIWDDHFGYLLDGEHAVVPGEFGGRYEGSDQVWQDAFVSYLLAKDAHSFFYWCLNPNSGDTGGLLMDDWKTPNMGKVDLLHRLMQ